jgi:GDSL-like Lipase/Acylhydrolase family
VFRDDRVVSMRAYLALGDSISIDDYTGVHGGGAASQLARKLRVELIDLTRDGNTTHGVLADLARAPAAADVVTLTAGGNDLLGGDLPRAILRRLHEIHTAYSRSAAASSSTPSMTQATATTTSGGGSSVYLGWRRSRCEDASTPSTAASSRSLASAGFCSPISSGSSTGTASPRTSPGSSR